MMTTTMMTITDSPTLIAGIRWLDYAAFAVMGLLWLFFFAMFFAIYRVLQSKARGDSGWGDSPGL